MIATSCVVSKTSTPVQIKRKVPTDSTHDDGLYHLLLMVRFPDGVTLHSVAAIHLNDESIVRDKGQFLIHKFNIPLSD